MLPEKHIHKESPAGKAEPGSSPVLRVCSLRTLGPFKFFLKFGHKNTYYLDRALGILAHIDKDRGFPEEYIV